MRPRTLWCLAPARLRSPLRSPASPSWWSCCCSGCGSAGATRTGCRGRCATRSSATATPRSSRRRSTGCTTPTTAQIPKSALADDAIAGVVAKLGDRFSNYFDPAQYKRFKDAQNSEFSGVGLQVSRHPKGLRVDAVYDGSPAKRAGLRQGDVIVAADGHDLAGLSQQESVDRVKGPPGSEVRLTWVRDGKRYTKTVSRSTVTVPVVASQLRSSGGCQVGVVRLSQFSSGAHAEVYAALRKLQKRGAKVFVLDLRDNGGGLVSEAQLIASAFLKDGPDRHHARARGQGADAARHRRPGRAHGADVGARQRRHRLGLRDRHRRAAGPRPREGRRHRDLRQGRLPGGPRALQRRRAGHHGRPVLHAQGPQPRRQGRLARARGSSPTSGPRTTPRRRPTRGSTGRWPSPAPSARPDRRPAARRPARAARPLPRRRAVLPARPAGDGRALARRAPRAPGAAASQREGRALQDRARARAPRRRPRRHRGADARSRPAALVPGRGRARRRGRAAARRRPPRPHRRWRPSPSTPSPRATSTTRSRARRSATSTGASGCTSPTSRPTCGPAARSTARPTGARPRSTCPGAVEPMLPEALSNDACSLRPGVERLAVTVELELRGARDGQGVLLPLADPLRRAPGLRPRRPHLRRRRRPRRSRGRSRWRRRARRQRRSRRAARAAARWPSSRSSPSSPSTAAATSSRRWRRSRPSRTGSSST